MNEADLTGLLRAHASRHSVPGAALGFLREGKTTCAYFGVVDSRTGEPVGPQTRFSVGSLTKSMVATVIAHLAEEGRLSLDDAIAAHLPELPSRGWVQHATLRDLLANRSGLPLSSALEFGFHLHTDVDNGALSRLVARVLPVGACDRDRDWHHLGRGDAARSGRKGGHERGIFQKLGRESTVSVGP